ncbi:MAG: ABC transporter ATP-binding protein [Gemmatimonadaceae bacterium]
MIVYQGFTKRYSDVLAVEPLSLTVEQGETLALVGPNGSGKTTLLKGAAGLVRATAGHIAIGGFDVAKRGREARRAVGYMPQRLGFPEGATPREVLRLIARLRETDLPRPELLLDRVGLEDVLDRQIETLSGGMRQRLGLAIALLGDPAVLLLDEPSAALDPTGALLMRDLLCALRQEGKTIVISSHDLMEAEAVADRLAVFVAGKLVGVGEPAELASSLDLKHGAGVEEIYRRLTGLDLRVAA